METVTDGTESDTFDTELDPSEDYVACKGIALENSDTNRIFKDGNDMKFEDTTTGEETTLFELKNGAELGAIGRYAIVLQHNGTVSDGTFIGYDSLLPGNTTPIVIPRDSILKDLSFSNSNSSADYTIEFRKNSTVATPFYSVSKVNTKLFTEIDIDETFSSGDELYIKYVDDGTNASDAVIVLFLQNQAT